MIQLRKGDCLELMRDIPDKRIDAIIADLPYGTTACKWDNVIPFEPLWEQYKRIIKDNGAIILFGSQPFTTKLIMSCFELFKYEWIWNKKMAGNVGLANRMPLKTHENICVFYKKQPTYNPQFHDNYVEMHGKFTETQSKSVNLSSKVKKLSGKRGFPRTIFECARPNNYTGGGLHPTQKPIGLLEMLIKTYTNEGEVVLDNTMGSGTTGVACVNTNRGFIGMELDDKYFEIAKERIEKAIAEEERTLFKDI